MHEIIILAGPNGAGKTTFAEAYLARRPRFVFLNADEIGKSLSNTGQPKPQLDIRAAREMLTRLEKLIADRQDVMLETTLATNTYGRLIPIWRGIGYHVVLFYLRLENVQQSIDGVLQRVARGGHDIPRADIMRRFQKSLDRLENTYKPIVNEWHVFEKHDGVYKLSASGNRP
jgi:predicted ABC-type ATPase